MKIVRSKRRSIGLSIGTDAEITIRAPKLAPLWLINKVIEQHKDWIAKKQAMMKARPRAKAKQFIEGEEFLFLGQKYFLKISENVFGGIAIHENYLELHHRLVSLAKKIIIEWYKKQARQIINERVLFYANLMKVKYNKVTINSANSRWGSCSSRKNLNFSWRLIMASMEIVDYVVVHELAHLIQANHSAKFWQIVEGVLADYKQRSGWLKDRGQELRIKN